MATNNSTDFSYNKLEFDNLILKRQIELLLDIIDTNASTINDRKAVPDEVFRSWVAYCTYNGAVGHELRKMHNK